MKPLAVEDLSGYVVSKIYDSKLRDVSSRHLGLALVLPFLQDQSFMLFYSLIVRYLFF